MNSPFKYEVNGGNIIQIIKDTGDIKSSVSVNDVDSICKYISDLDNELWTLRGYYSEMKENLEGKLFEIKAIVG